MMAPSRASMAKATGTSMTPPMASSCFQGDLSVCIICPICMQAQSGIRHALSYDGLADADCRAPRNECQIQKNS